MKAPSQYVFYREKEQTNSLKAPGLTAQVNKPLQYGLQEDLNSNFEL